MSEHSYGHGDTCHYCGCDGDTEDDKPGNDSVNKRPTDEDRARWAKRSAAARELEVIATDFDLDIIEADEVLVRVTAWVARCTISDLRGSELLALTDYVMSGLERMRERCPTMNYSGRAVRVNTLRDWKAELAQLRVDLGSWRAIADLRRIEVDALKERLASLTKGQADR